MNLESQKIKSIKKIGLGRVRNLTVNKNHTFLTSNGIVTHNCDLASNKIMVLQSVLEGKPLFLKKIGRFIYPKSGFNIIATANTKGKGSDDGRFIGTNVLNDAFLERFAVTFEQSYPSPAIEQKILTKVSSALGLTEIDDFIKKLCDWSDVIRKTFFDGGIDELISTRRLVHIIRAYRIFENKGKAIKVCVNRFDDETKQAFLELYDKIDADFVMPEKEVDESQDS
jgi:MoxR-like ATPase